MPIYDFSCEQCQHEFEDIVVKDVMPTCPRCASKKIIKKISAPSPLKTGAFPYKVGPVHPVMNMPKRQCPKAGG